MSKNLGQTCFPSSGGGYDVIFLVLVTFGFVYHLIFSDTLPMEAHFSLLVTEVSFESKGLFMYVIFKTVVAHLCLVGIVALK